MTNDAVLALAYAHETLEIIAPQCDREINKAFISDFIKILLEEIEIEFYPLGSTTFKHQVLQQAIEPDCCFYIKNEAAVRGKPRLNLAIDPPPDLALEIDITSRSHPEIYAALGVPELWQFDGENLEIKVLESGQYVSVEFSPNFPNLPLKTIIPQYLNRAKTQGRNRTMKAFRAWVQTQMSA
ncbi:MAG: Uma2 family endonuclease [Jaaginema sp. PMC 1080.18]|nr:Uma2 family endonuclease [Jaaginema sp. PMC 1080.18]MEC4869096.1 Uma2 family endonuclease [Jaaginema sp. PMC 1078.18]